MCRMCVNVLDDLSLIPDAVRYKCTRCSATLLRTCTILRKNKPCDGLCHKSHCCCQGHGQVAFVCILLVYFWRNFANCPLPCLFCFFYIPFDRISHCEQRGRGRPHKDEFIQVFLEALTNEVLWTWRLYAHWEIWHLRFHLTGTWFVSPDTTKWKTFGNEGSDHRARPPYSHVHGPKLWTRGKLGPGKRRATLHLKFFTAELHQSLLCCACFSWEEQHSTSSWTARSWWQVCF